MWHRICNVYDTDVLYRASISALTYYIPQSWNTSIKSCLFFSYNTSILELFFNVGIGGRYVCGCAHWVPGMLGILKYTLLRVSLYVGTMS